MPKNAGSTNQLQVSPDDFVCVKDNVLWLLGHKQFYMRCVAFKPLQANVAQLLAFMEKHGLLGGDIRSCKNCDIFKVIGAQGQLLDNFAKILIWLYDRGRMDELRGVLRFVSDAKRRPYRRLILAYAGKATGKAHRLVIVE